MTMKEELIEKIHNKTLTMGVCGLGYVGLPLAVDKAKHGFKTIGFDVQQEKVDLTEAVASKKKYLVGYEKNICPPSVSNSDPDKPVSHFRFVISGASPETRISIDSSVDANENGDNSRASRCFVFDLKVTRKI